MRITTLAIVTGLLSFGTAAWAAEGGATQTTTGNAAARMQGSPNAAGFGKGETTGSTSTATTPSTQDMKQDGRMQGSPNAAGFKGSSTSGAAGGR